MPASMELASGERRSLEVAVRNAGELEGNFRLLADAPVGVGAPYDRSLRLAPGATAREAVPLAPQRAGSYELVVRAQGASGEPRAERRVRLTVREGGSGPWSLPSARGLLPWLLPPLALALLLNLRRRAGPSWGFR
jgi:hypothetical protein